MNITIFANELIPGKLYKANINIYYVFGYQTAVKRDQIFMFISQIKLKFDVYSFPVEEWETRILLNEKIVVILSYLENSITPKVSPL